MAQLINLVESYWPKDPVVAPVGSTEARTKQIQAMVRAFCDLPEPDRAVLLRALDEQQLRVTTYDFFELPFGQPEQRMRPMALLEWCLFGIVPQNEASMLRLLRIAPKDVFTKVELLVGDKPVPLVYEPSLDGYRIGRGLVLPRQGVRLNLRNARRREVSPRASIEAAIVRREPY